MSNERETRPYMRQTTIGIVGDGGAQVAADALNSAEVLGAAVMSAGWTLVTGGLGGVMEAACRGARCSDAWRPGSVVGVLPGHDANAANQWVDIALATGLDLARNSIVAHCDAVVAIGGGAGTLSELAFAWQLQRLVVAFDVAGWSSKLAGRPLDGRKRFSWLEDDQIFKVYTATEAVKLIREKLPAYVPSYTGAIATG